MAEPPIPSSKDLRDLLNADPAREAVAALRGYDWQRWATIEWWLQLSGEQVLWIECGEDFTIAGEGEVLTFQAKDRSDPISLGQKKTRDIISNAFVRDPSVTTVVWTRASLGTEQGNPFGEPGILHWRKVVEGSAPSSALREYLSANGHLRTDAARKVREANEAGLRDLLAKVIWMTNEPAIDKLRQRVSASVEQRLCELDIYGAATGLRDDAAAYLFAHVARIGVRKNADERQLTRIVLNDILLEYNAKRLRVALPVFQAATGFHVPPILQEISEKLDGLAAHGALGNPKTVADASLTSGLSPSRSHDASFDEALERDLALRYLRASQKELFSEFSGDNLYEPLARNALDEVYARVDPALRRSILLRAARAAAVHGNVANAEKLLALAIELAGPDSDVPARARIAHAKSEVDEALQLVRDDASADARSVLLSILIKEGRGEEALSWLRENDLAPSQLTAAGVRALANFQLGRGEFDAFLSTLEGLTESQCAEGPSLLLLRGVARLASVFAISDRQQILNGFPATLRGATPVLPEEEITRQIDGAIADLQRLQIVGPELEIQSALRTAERFLRWAELVHPAQRDAALERLRRDMTDPQTAMCMLQFAVAYDPTYDPKSIANMLERREKLGGWSNSDLEAAFVFHCEGDDPKARAAFIDKYRSRLETVFEKPSLQLIEICALAQCGDVALAKRRLSEMPQETGAAQRALVEAEIAKAEGADPVSEHERVFLEQGTTEALRALVQAAYAKGDRLTVAKYSEELFARTADPRDIRLAARALASLKHGAEFARLADCYPAATQGDEELQGFYARALFELGRFNDAKDALTPLTRRELDLEAAIAIESGAWETLGAITAEYLVGATNHDGISLIRAAALSQAADDGPVLGLIDAAVERAPDNPEVLVGAYTIVMEEGFESRRPQAHDWFRRALELSGSDGPVKQIELKDVLADRVDWVAHVQDINTATMRGDLPLSIAASGLRTTLVDIVLQSLVRNTTEEDPRKRIVLPLFTGAHTPTAIGSAQTAAFDLTALLTLGWLEVLPKALELYPRVLIPAGALGELFEGRRRLKTRQKSRVISAHNIRNEVAAGRLKVMPESLPRLQSDLTRDLGSLIEAAESRGGVVICPAPVNRLGKLDEQVDLGARAHVFSDLNTLLDALIQAGVVDVDKESLARRYFQMHDEGWPASVTPRLDQPLYLDRLALVYLQDTRLLGTVLSVFEEVFVHSSVEDEARGLLAHEECVAKALETIEAIRAAMKSALDSGVAAHGGSNWDAEERGNDDSLLNLMQDLAGVDVAVIDDRHINTHEFVIDRKGRRVRIATSLDILDELRALEMLSGDDWRSLRHKLRAAAVLLLPATADEIAKAAQRNRQREAPEFRAIRESLTFPHMTGAIRLPRETRWLADMSNSAKNAVMQLWLSEPDKGRAAQLSSDVVALLPKPVDWVPCWDGEPPAHWAELVERTLLAGISFPAEISDAETLHAYHAWLEERILEPTRSVAPDKYQEIVQQIRSLILKADDDDNITDN